MSVLDSAVAWYQANPAKGNAAIATVVSAALGVLGFAVEAPEVVTVVAVVVPILLSGLATHKKVTPV